jgi:SPP1 gp7 family putative phage head morphogenesis protein
VNHARQRELGVERFVWRTMGDERVRDEHDELKGETFSYDDPPEIDGEPTLPGDDVQCRCYAEPVLDDLFDDEEDPDEDPDEDDSDDESQ